YNIESKFGDSASWVEVEASLLADIRREIRRTIELKRRAIVILSEVWWATGLALPVAGIIRTLRAEFPEHVIFIVDEAHVPGNVDRFDAALEADSYVLSAHKWLFAAEPCGILINKRKDIKLPYDAWALDFPETTASVRMIAH